MNPPFPVSSRFPVLPYNGISVYSAEPLNARPLKDLYKILKPCLDHTVRGSPSLPNTPPCLFAVVAGVHGEGVTITDEKTRE